jgi:hypothetical protein
LKTTRIFKIQDFNSIPSEFFFGKNHFFCSFKLIKMTLDKTSTRKIKIVVFVLVFLVSIVTITFDLLFYFNTFRSWNNGNSPGFIEEIQSPYDLFGIFWINENGSMVRQKFGQSVHLDAFDPEKPVLIYVHGWEKNSVQRKFIETNNYANNDDKYGVNVNLAKSWKDLGWNFGIFQWARFSDEDEVEDAETKIWSSRNMRWRRNDLGMDDSTFNGFFRNKSVGDLLYLTLSESLIFRNASLNFRLVGHSLGSQLLIHYCSLVLKSSDSFKKSFLPNQIVMVDAYLTLGLKDYLNGLNSQIVAVHTLEKLENVSKLLIQSSPIPEITLNSYTFDLLSKVLYVRLTPSYISLLDFPSLHVSGINLYLYQYSHKLFSNDSDSNIPAILSDSTILSLSSQSIALIQSQGGSTFNISDDKFSSTPLRKQPKKNSSTNISLGSSISSFPSLISIILLLILGNLFPVTAFLFIILRKRCTAH